MEKENREIIPLINLPEASEGNILEIERNGGSYKENLTRFIT